MSTGPSGIAPGYIHGFDPHEQERLREQARFLAPSVLAHVGFDGARRILEVGCGVGAQTTLLLERFPRARIDGVDAAEVQVAAARAHLADAIAAGRASVVVGDALRLPYAAGAHDAAFVCWFLEHVARPVDILRELRRTLRSGARVHCAEVLNATLHLEPACPATMAYWTAYNRHQASVGGDPNVGAKLGNLLVAAGFADVRTSVRPFHLDRRDPAGRARFIAYWTELLRSGAPALVGAGAVAQHEVDAALAELVRVAGAEDGVFFYAFVEGMARVP